MAILPTSQNSSLLDWIDDVPPNVKSELKNRYDELSQLQQQQIQEGTTVPQLYGSLSRFIANPATVSVETCKRMIDTDETIGAGIDFMNLSMISRWGEYKHKNPKIQKFVRKALERMEGSWHENLEEMFSAEWNGFSMTEQVWEFVSDFDGAPAFVPKKLVTYPATTIVFAVNRHGEILPDGVYQYQRFHNAFFNQYMGLQGGELDGFRPDMLASIGDFPYPIRIAADLTYLTVKIPKNKCILLRSSVSGKMGNPYGRSCLRRMYKSWVAKDAFLKMWLIAADRKGSPLLVGYASPNDTVLQESYSGQDGELTNERPVKAQRADEALAQTMKQLHNSSFITLPGKKGETYELEAISTQGDFTVFKDAVEYCNRSLMRGMLLPPLVLGGDGGGSFSLGQEHNKIFKQIVDGKLKPYKQNVIDQFIQKLIAYNFPKSMWEADGLGEFALEDYDPDLLEKLGIIFGNLTEKGYMSAEDQTDMDLVRERFNMPKKAAVAPMAMPMGNGEEEAGNGNVGEAVGQPSAPDAHEGDPQTPNAKAEPKVEDDAEDYLPPNYNV